MATTGAKHLQPVYLLYGSHPRLIKQAVSRLMSILKEHGVDLTLGMNIFDGRSASAADILAACAMSSLLSSRRVVVVNEIDSLSTDDKNKLAAYIGNPNPAVTLVLLQAGTDKFGKPKVSKSSKIFKAAQASPQVVVKEYVLTQRDLPMWVSKAFAGKGLTILPRAADYLIALCGRDLDKLETEIEKISLLNQEKETVDIDDMKGVISPTLEGHIFQLIEALFNGQLDVAIQVANTLLTLRESAGSIMYMIERQLRLLANLKSRLPDRPTDKELAAELGVSTGQLYYLKKQARQFRLEAYPAAVEAQIAVDQDRKTGRLSDNLAVERLILTVGEMLLSGERSLLSDH